MPGRSWIHSLTRRRVRGIDEVGARVITLKLENITDLQKHKLDRLQPALRTRLEDRQLSLKELMNLGEKSFLSIVVYGYDRFSGTRSVAAYSEFRSNDVDPTV
jgi:hypothetical protein